MENCLFTSSCEFNSRPPLSRHVLTLNVISNKKHGEKMCREETSICREKMPKMVRVVHGSLLRKASDRVRMISFSISTSTTSAGGRSRDEQATEVVAG